ncbi:MAG: hypothetical protein ABI273_11465 [Lacunisphaera sp.]
MDCHHLTLSFARKNSIDLYAIENHGTVDIFTGNAPTRECFWASRVRGSVKEIVWDQHKKPVPWESIPLPGFCQTPEVDSRRGPDSERALGDLRYGVANAMNRTMKDPGFSRFVNKQIVGAWKAERSRLEFFVDGDYRVDGWDGPMGRVVPPEGKWNAGGRMLHLMTKANDRGARIALVSVGESELRFHGHDGALFHVYERA